MACRLVGAKPLSEPMLIYCHLVPKELIQWNFNRKSNIFIQENAFESVVWNLAAILSRPQRKLPYTQTHTKPNNKWI